MSQGAAVLRWIATLSPRRRLALAASAGGLAALGLAPFDLWLIGVPAFAGLLLLSCLEAEPRRAARVAWIGATAYFAVALHWIVEPFFVDAARHGWMAPFALVFLAGGLALFWAMPAWIAVRLVPPSRPGSRLGVAAGLVVLFEVARAAILSGFPWAHPGHVLIGSPLLSLSAFGGPHGLNVLVLGLAAATAAAAVRGRAMLTVALAGAPVLGGLVAASLAAPPDAPLPEAAVVRLVQPNAPQHLKWREDMVPVFFERALDLTAATPDGVGRRPDLVVWPETALPVLLERSDAVRARIAAASVGAQVIVGGQRFEGFRARNTSALLDSEGRIRQVYDKHHLVPFGEYMPGGAVADALGLAGMAEVLAGGYAPGPGPQLLEIGGSLGRAFPMICYEAIFPGYIRDVERPDWMVHLTNDAWFGNFSGPFQHLALARLRAAEQGVPVLRAANTGVSAVIDARGRILASLPLDEAGFLDAPLPRTAAPTRYARTGDLPVVLVVIFATAALLLNGRRRARPLHPGR